MVSKEIGDELQDLLTCRLLSRYDQLIVHLAMKHRGEVVGTREHHELHVVAASAELFGNRPRQRRLQP